MSRRITRRGGSRYEALPAVGARACDEGRVYVGTPTPPYIPATRRASDRFLHRPSLQRTPGYRSPGAQRANRGLVMTSTITAYLDRRKSRQAKAQPAASKAMGRPLTSSTWGATAATGEQKSEDEDNANKVAEGYRQPDVDEADDLAPASGIAVSVLVGIAMWLAIVALVRLITGFLA